jgi:Flp pilus assembly protein TadB
VKVQEAAEVKASELLSEKVQHSQQLLQLERERAKVQRERVDNLKKFLFQAGVQLSRTPVALVIMLVCAIAGLVLGLNLLPTAVACKSVDSLCYHLRFNKETTVAPEKPVAKDKRVVPLKKKSKKRF